MDLLDLLGKENQTLTKQEMNNQQKGTSEQEGERNAEKEDHDITIWSDASWKKGDETNDSDMDSTGIGIYIFQKREKGHLELKIQASTSGAISPLQAEAKAMLLAVMIAEKMNYKEPILYTDNILLAKAVNSNKIDSDFIHWNTRDTLAKILNSVRNMNARVYHVCRDKNKIAHNCAHKVQRNHSTVPILKCSATDHSFNSCPWLNRFSSMNWQEYVIHYVNCC
jgi:ribonuclease HI